MRVEPAGPMERGVGRAEMFRGAGGRDDVIHEVLDGDHWCESSLQGL